MGGGEGKKRRGTKEKWQFKVATYIPCNWLPSTIDVNLKNERTTVYKWNLNGWISTLYVLYVWGGNDFAIELS
jgi:hypothetical protein